MSKVTVSLYVEPVVEEGGIERHFGRDFVNEGGKLIASLDDAEAKAEVEAGRMAAYDKKARADKAGA